MGYKIFILKPIEAEEADLCYIFIGTTYKLRHTLCLMSDKYHYL